MKKNIPHHMIEKIFRLNLPIKLIANGKKVYPAVYRNKSGKSGYIVSMNMSQTEYLLANNWEIEIKGTVDVESVKYCGKGILKPFKAEPSYYHLTNVELHRENLRRYKRVPYKRELHIIEPIDTKAILMDLSASGAMMYSLKKLESDKVTFNFTLAKKPLTLIADIMEQTYLENQGVYKVRCHFDPIEEQDKLHINKVVNEIVRRAKERLK